MECCGKGPERKVITGRINKNKMRVYQMRKYQRRIEKFKVISNCRHPTVSEELIELYEKTFGVAKQFNESHLQDPESYFRTFKDPESHYRSLNRDKDIKDKNVR